MMSNYTHFGTSDNLMDAELPVMTPTPPECQCQRCQRGCTYKPGWFMPGEAEVVAAHLGMSLPELFQAKLGIDWWDRTQHEGGNIDLLAPAVTNWEPGVRYSEDDPLGQCVFYENGRCSIHEVKPFECRHSHHSMSLREHRHLHARVAEAWDTPESREQIAALEQAANSTQTDAARKSAGTS